MTDMQLALVQDCWALLGDRSMYRYMTDEQAVYFWERILSIMVDATR